MGQYNSTLASGPASVAAPPQEHDLLSAIKARYNRPGSSVMKILSTLSLPGQVVSSMVREGVEREQQPHMPELSMGQAALRGIANPETSYQDIEGVGKKTGIGLDIAIDPLWIVPGSVFAKAGTTTARTAGKLAGGALRRIPGAEAVVARQLPKVIKHYDKTRAGYKGFEDEVEVAARMAENEVQYDLLDKTADEIAKLVPDPQRRMAVLEAAELIQPESVSGKIGALFYSLPKDERKALIIGRHTSEMIDATRTKLASMTDEAEKAKLIQTMNDRMRQAADDINKLVPDATRQKAIFEAMSETSKASEGTMRVGPARQLTGPTSTPGPVPGLNANEMQAAKLALASAKKIQELRTKWGVLSEETALGFEELHGLTYFSRSALQSREGMLRDLDIQLARPGLDAEGQAYLKAARDHIANADDFPSESYVREMMRGASSGRPHFTKERDVMKSLKEMGASDDAMDRLLYAMVEKDVAKNLHQSSTATARAVYRKIYLNGFVNYMKKNNLLHSEDDLLKLPAHLRGRGDNALVKIEGIKELDGLYGPRVLVQDIKDQVLSPLDPDRVRNSVSLARRINSYWRGWALSVPMTTVRNMMDSVVWRNAAGGMTGKDAPHIFRMADLVKNHKAGTLSASEKKTYREMVRAGVVRSNVYEEARNVMEKMEPRNFIHRIIDPNPSRNPYTRFFFDKGGAVEDVSRGSMFLWRRSQGDTVEQAMKHVNKWHIDYRYGLTQYERNIRDKYIPFLTFTRFNMPLALETLMTKPKLVAGAGKAIEAHEDLLGGPEPDFPLAGWMADGTPLRWRYDEESKNYFIQMLDGWWSFTDVNKFIPGRMLDEAVGMISPIYVRPYEVIKNHSLFMSRGRTDKVPVERPGDKFELMGAEIKVPFGKRVEYLARTFRPLDEADKVLQAASSKYGSGPWERGINAFNRAMFGRQYPTNREAQLRIHDGVTSKQLQAIRSAKKRAEAEGDQETVDDLTAKEQALKDLRKELGIK